MIVNIVSFLIIFSLVIICLVSITIAWLILYMIILYHNPAFYNIDGSVNLSTTLWVTVTVILFVWLILAFITFWAVDLFKEIAYNINYMHIPSWY